MEEFPYIMAGTCQQEPELRYATGFSAPDAVAAARLPNGEVILMVSDLEYGRACKQAAKGCRVISAASVNLPPEQRKGDLVFQLSNYLVKLGYNKVALARSVSVGYMNSLQHPAIHEIIFSPSSPFEKPRMIKSAAEQKEIRKAQRVAHGVARLLKKLITHADVDAKGRLIWEDTLLTSERARKLVRLYMIEHDCLDEEDTIVAGGLQAADPHQVGTGPLYAKQWIVCDIFPRRTVGGGYWGDLTRTLMHGKPFAEQQKLFDAVQRAHDLGISLVKPGVLAADIHKAVAESLAQSGYATGHDAKGSPFGFFHSTGHGVGLQIHEHPRISPAGKTILEPGMVFTVEPGLYYPKFGGVRIEDTVLVTENGCEIL